ncbi:bifunctional diguanylate cyclase/phosphodiesterase [Marinobacter sp. NSM]|uniref:bifunctional diguanylate cyclase/phosphodiesterase n=1 Tax=Marinobacter sp. NSM TaxID=3458004 RepID=UPI00403624AE
MIDNNNGAPVDGGAIEFLAITRSITYFWHTGAVPELQSICAELGKLFLASRCALLCGSGDREGLTVRASWSRGEPNHSDMSLVDCWPELRRLSPVLDYMDVTRLNSGIANQRCDLLLSPLQGRSGCLAGILALEVDAGQSLDVELEYLRTVGGLLGCALDDINRRAHNGSESIQGDTTPELALATNIIKGDDNAVDELTGLMVRHSFRDIVGRFIEFSSERECFGGFFLIDLDNFRLINDAEGHATGDKLLAGVASRLEYVVPPGGALSRIEGDVFAFATPQLSNTEQGARESAEVLVERVHQMLSRPFSVENQDMTLTASIGVALFYNYASTFEEVLRHSELSMYKAKDDGKNRSCFFSTELQRAINERVDLDSALKLAISEQQFKLNYQLQVDHKGTPIGVEALIRWHRPGVGMISPGVFIPFAEANGLILDIGRWVLHEACRQLAVWSAGHRSVADLVIAVNVSSEQFKQASFVDEINTALAESGAPANRLKLEVTESALAQDLVQVADKMRRLKELGVRFSLDDFGTGYSSLRYVKDLPFDELKIDQSFVRGITKERTDEAIASMMLALARSTGLNALAEGVETREELDILLSLGCPAFQGYFFGRPQASELIADAVVAQSLSG